MAYIRTLEELLAGMQQRDRQALAELYGRFAPSLMGMLLRSLGDRSGAEAVIAEVFLDLWKRARGTGWDRRQRSCTTCHGCTCRCYPAVTRRKGLGPFRNQRIHRYLRKFLPWLPEPGAIASLATRREVMSRVMKDYCHSASARRLIWLCSRATRKRRLRRKLGDPLGRVKSELRAGLRFLRHRLRAVLGTWSATI